MSSPKILIIEDDVDFARTLAMALKMRGIALDHAPDAATAMKMAGEQPYRLCFADIKMPGMDGVDCVRELRGVLPDTTHYVIMTGFRDKANLDRVKDAGISHVLLKPFRMAEFVQLVETLTA